MSANRMEIDDISMPFLSMVIFMVKWVIASIPALIILFVLFGIVFGLFGGILAGIGDSWMVVEDKAVWPPIEQ